MSTATIPIFGSADELMLGILRPFFHGSNVHIGTLFSSGLEPPIIIARRERRSGTQAIDTADDRFTQPVVMSINTITSGVDADEVGEELQEACRIAIRQAVINQTVVPGAGHITRVDNAIVPSRVSDWATSTGVVQYASLPKGWVRYESVYRLILSPPEQALANNRFVTPSQ